MLYQPSSDKVTPSNEESQPQKAEVLFDKGLKPRLRPLRLSEDLFHAAETGNVELFDIAIQAGANILANIPFFKANCGHLACGRNRLNILNYIESKFTDVEIQNLFTKENFLKMTPALVACRDDRWGRSALDWAIVQQNFEGANFLVYFHIYQILAKCRHDGGAYALSTEMKASIESVIDLRMKNGGKERVRVDGGLMNKKSTDLTNLSTIALSACTKLLDSVETREEILSLLTPMQILGGDYFDSEMVIDNAFEKEEIEILCHKAIQYTLFCRFDPHGAISYISDMNTAFFCIFVTLAYYCEWAIVFPPTVILRWWIPNVYVFSQKDRYDEGSTRYQFQIACLRWCISHFTVFIYLVLHSHYIYHIPWGAPSCTAMEYLLIFWCVGTLLEKGQLFYRVGWKALNFWNICDATSAVGMINFILSARLMLIPSENTIRNSATLLALASILLYLRMLVVVELNQNIGVLLQTIISILTANAPHFFLLLSIFVSGFVVGMTAFFSDYCVDDLCENYDMWAEDWRGSYTQGFFYFFQVYLGQGDTSGFGQKYFGKVFLMIYSIITSILLINVFIALLSQTFSEIGSTSRKLHRYNLARVVFSFINKEAIWAPINTLDMTSFTLAFCVQSCLGYFVGPSKSMRWFPALAVMKQQEPEPMFCWYFPQETSVCKTILQTRYLVCDRCLKSMQNDGLNENRSSKLQ